MKYSFGLSLFILCGSTILSSCAPSPTSNEPTKRMLVSPDTLHLSAPKDTANANVALSCGCSFGFHVNPVSGATDKFQPIFAATDTTVSHTLRFVVVPGTPSGSYSAVYDVIGGDFDALHHIVSITATF